MDLDRLRAIVVFDIDGVVRDVSKSYRRAIADTVEEFSAGAYRPEMADIDELKSEGIWNNDWQASQELAYRYYESQGISRTENPIDYDAVVSFFQAKYRGKNPELFDGYIASEPLLMSKEYLATLTHNSIGWGFFSGATRGSAEYVLEHRLGLKDPVLVAMEDAPGKPNPKGLFMALKQITNLIDVPAIYVGDTVADMQTAIEAKTEKPEGTFIGVGVLPPHVQTSPTVQQSYAQNLKNSGAAVVLDNVQQLDVKTIDTLII